MENPFGAPAKPENGSLVQSEKRQASVEQEKEDEFAGIGVSFVGEGSPAEEAGLMTGDVIVSVNSNPVEGATNFLLQAMGTTGDPVHLSVLRDGSTVELTLHPRFNESTGRYMAGFRYATYFYVYKHVASGEKKLFQRLKGLYRDEQGESLCSYLIDLHAEPEDIFDFEADKYNAGFQIDSIRVQAGGKSLDVLKTFNKYETPIFLVKNMAPGTGHHDPIKNEIVVSDIETPAYLRILFHELIHAEQDKNPDWAEVLKEYGRSNFLLDHRKFFSTPFSILLTKAEQRTPELFEGADLHGALRKIVEIQTRGNEAINRLETEENAPQKIDLIHHEIEAIYNEASRVELRPGFTIFAALAYPRWFVERNAEYGSIVGLREIKRAIGADFLRGTSPLTERDFEVLEHVQDEELMKTQPLEIRKVLTARSKELADMMEAGSKTAAESIHVYMNLLGATHKAIRELAKQGIRAPSRAKS
jgi:hypothetical protein